MFITLDCLDPTKSHLVLDSQKDETAPNDRKATCRLAVDQLNVVFSLNRYQTERAMLIQEVDDKRSPKYR